MSEHRAQRRLAAILAADVAGYSRMMGADETGTLATLREIWSETFNPIVATYHGRIVKIMGDGALVEFASAVDAVECAVAVQLAMRQFNASNGTKAPVEFRIGLNIGDIVIDGADIFGDGVNVAARLESQAPLGGILGSDAIHAQVKGKVGVIFSDSGELALKNIAKPVRAWRWTANAKAAAPVPAGSPSLPVNDLPTIAVLPFNNMSNDADQEFFAAGLRLDLESALGLIDGIGLLADSTSANFHLTGSVRAASGQIRVTARLVEAVGGRQLWSGRFDGRADDIFAFQDEITRQVAVAMQIKLTAGDYARLWDGQTKSLAAWERCVAANAHHQRWTEADNRRARDLLCEALEIDPDYFAAKVYLGKTWWYDARYYAQGEGRE